MILDEQELRQHLATATDHVSAPRFSIDGLISRIRRRRARILRLVSGSLLAVAALAVAVPVAWSGPGTSPTVARPPIAPLRLSFTAAVNGHSPENGSPPSFTVTPGKHLRIQIGVIVPAHAKVTALWLGITKGDFSSPGRGGHRPAGLRPVLAHTGKPLTPGRHTFRLTLIMPGQLPSGTTLWLVAGWTTRQEDARVGQGIAKLVAPR